MNKLTETENNYPSLNRELLWVWNSVYYKQCHEIQEYIVYFIFSLVKLQNFIFSIHRIERFRLTSDFSIDLLQCTSELQTPITFLFVNENIKCEYAFP